MEVGNEACSVYRPGFVTAPGFVTFLFGVKNLSMMVFLVYLMGLNITRLYQENIFSNTLIMGEKCVIYVANKGYPPFSYIFCSSRLYLARQNDEFRYK